MKRRIIVLAMPLLSLLFGRARAADLQPGSSQDTRYKQNPVYILFESYILDVVGHLPPEKANMLESSNLQKALKTKATEWRACIREALNLSETIDVAILDLWYQNSDIARNRGERYSPEQFAVNFTDEYMKDGSRVHIWPPGALDAAKKRIAARRAKAKHGA